MTSAHRPALEYVFGLELFGVKLGLDNIRALTEALGHPERQYRSVHVAGTNGKGSVTAMVDRALGAAGYRSGRYTSPHLVALNERFVVAGDAVSTDALETVAADVRDTILALLASHRLQAPPTFFEATTAVAFELFRRCRVDMAVCEVGLGGRLDATNVLVPTVSAVTSIGHDHRDQLGDTLAHVAVEKAGIIKPGTPVVIGPMATQPAAVMAAVARERAARLVRAYDGVTVRDEGHTERGGRRITLRTPRHDYGVVEMALAGTHQIDNAVVAVRVLEMLDELGARVPPEAVVAGLERVRWPGRLDRRRLPDGRDLLLDAAHNLEGAASLAAFLKDEPEGPRVLVFGAMRDKDVAGMLACLMPMVSAGILAAAPGARAADPSELARIAHSTVPATPVHVAPSSAAALTLAWRHASRVVVAGSIFLIGEILGRDQASW